VKMLAGHRHRPRARIQLVLALLGITSAAALEPLALGHAQDAPPPPKDAPPKAQTPAPAKDARTRKERREQQRIAATLRGPSAKPAPDTAQLRTNAQAAPDATGTTPATPNAPPRSVSGPAAPLGQPATPDAPPDPKAFETGLPYEPTPPRSMVTFNLEDASLTDLIRLISQITGRRFILPGTTRAIKATVYAPTKVSAAEAYQAFLSILELNGMTIVPAGKYLKVVESSRIEGRTIPLLASDDELPEGDRFITRLQRVASIPAEDAASLLERFKSGDGSITAYAPTNMLIITDTGTNIRRMLRILEVIDVAATGEQIWVEPIHHASATEVAARLSEIFEPSSGTNAKGAKKPATPPAAKPKPGGGTTETIGSGSSEQLTKILADERTNSLIIVATERSYLRILEMLKYLDVSMQGGGRIHVHHLQHTDAEEIASTLQSLVSGKGGSSKGRAGATPAPAGGGGEPTDIFEGSVGITANKGSNAIVITSSAHDYAALRPVIDLLDSSRKQVFIEAVIMELSVDRTHTFGVAFHGGLPNVPVEDSVSVLGFQASKTIGGLVGNATNGELLTGLALGVQGPTIEGSQQQFGISLPGFGVAINALATSGDANILSTPHLIATDNVEAEISVGQNVPLQQTTGVTGLGGLGALAGLSGLQNQVGAGAAGGLGALGLGGLGGSGGFGVPRQDVGTTVTITPHINDSNEIRLQISQEISSAGAPSNQGQGAVTIDRTRAKTEVVVRDQQTVVIGGLMRDQITTGDSKVPVLGDLPLIGALFKTSSKQKIKKNLLLFLTPYIIRSPDDLRSIYERKMRERQEFLDRYFVFGDDFAPAVDYSRTRGLVGEVLLELKLLDEKRQLIKDLEVEPGGTHEPRPPVGRALGESVTTGDEVIGPEDGAQSPPEQTPPAEAAPPMPEPPPVPEAPESTQ
jgi:general secretion pathway protein D